MMVLVFILSQMAPKFLVLINGPKQDKAFIKMIKMMKESQDFLIISPKRIPSDNLVDRDSRKMIFKMKRSSEDTQI
jgi:hypothetical protein